MTTPSKSTPPGAQEVDRAQLTKPYQPFSIRLRDGLRDFAVFILLGLVLISWYWSAYAFITLPLFLLVCVLTHLTGAINSHWEIERPVFFLAPLTTRWADSVVRRPAIRLYQTLRYGFCALPPTPLAKPDYRGQGMWYAGNALDKQGLSLWFSKEQLVTHSLVLGQTGSGKTEALLGMLQQYMTLGSGFIFVDGKADITTLFKLYGIADSLGLADNLLVINFLTSGLTQHIKNTRRLSNTLNPFAGADADSIMNMLSLLMGPSKNDNQMWRGRAEALGQVVVRALCELQEQGHLIVSLESIREHLKLKKIEELLHIPLLSAANKASVLAYLEELPGWKTSQSEEPNIAAKGAMEADKQHGYLTMQFTEALDLLINTYGHITHTDIGEVDFADVINSGRFLYVMLPSLEKSSHQLNMLGRLILMAIKRALVPLLGSNQVSGTKEALLDTRANRESMPFAIVLDEYGQYAEEGFASICAQARSLNVAITFAGQDYASFKKASPHEASSIMANTGIKLFMKVEDEETLNLAIKRGGDAYQAMTQHVQQHDGLPGINYQDTGTAQIQRLSRLTQDNLIHLKPGEGYLFYGNRYWHTKTYYGNFKSAKTVKLNTFIKIRRPVLSPCTTP